MARPKMYDDDDIEVRTVLPRRIRNGMGEIARANGRSLAAELRVMITERYDQEAAKEREMQGSAA